MKRKIIALMLMLCMIFQTLSITISASTTSTAEITRDTVLVLDNSVSMEGSPLVYLKQAAIKFCNSVLNAAGINRVAVVVYDTDITESLNFTDNIDDLSDIINDMDAEGNWTNINIAVEKADELLMNSNADIKNIVVMTDGVPTAGDYKTSGPYSYNDYSSNHNASRYCYEYANALYDTAIALHNDYSIYTLGFYHTMAPTTKAFATKVLRDIQNAGYYEVENVEDLEFVFGEVADDITQSNGYFKYRGNLKQDKDTQAEYYYFDEYFYDDARTYNASLATMSFCLELSAGASYEMKNWYNPNYTEDDSAFWEDRLINVKTLLLGDPNNKDYGFGGIGFTDFAANEFWEDYPTYDSIGAIAAQKKINDGNEDYTLIALAVRGTGYGGEWASNFTIGKQDDGKTDGNHQGFSEARDNVLKFLNDYIENHVENGKIKLWLVGYSRGAATANMVAGALNENFAQLPAKVSLETKDLYCYTFATPQGMMSYNINKSIDFKNIHNIVNLNDLVPMVAPEDWGFTRYNKDSYTSKYLPTSSTTESDFDALRAAMIDQLENMGFKEEDYVIDETTDSPTLVGINYWKVLPGGASPLIWDANASSLPTEKVLHDAVSLLFQKLIVSRSAYANEMQDSVRNLTGEFLNDYGNADELKKAFEQTLSNFTELWEDHKAGTITKIIGPIMNPFNNPEEAYNKLHANILQIVNEAVTPVKNTGKLSDDAVAFLTERLVDLLLVSLGDALFDNNYDSINTVLRLIESIMPDEGEAESALGQAHYTDIYLAWLRSLDHNFNPTVESDLLDSVSNISRIIRINCPVNINVYDSTGKLVASIIDDVVVEDLGSIVCLVNSNGEKIVYLPGDEDYRVDIIATDDGYVSYAVNEYNFVYGTETRILNYYNVPVTTGDVLKGLVPKISDDELQDNDPNGSTADYQLLDKNSDTLPVDTEYTGEQIADQYFDVTLQKEGNGGYVTGAGTFLEGHFAQVTAQALPSAEFYGWYEGDTLVSDEMTYRFAVTKDITLTAKFNDVEFHEMKLAAAEGGKVTSVEGYYSEGMQIAVVAEPDEGYVFDYWTTSDGGAFEDINEAYTFFTMPNNEVTVTAHFKVGTADEPNEPNEPEQPKNTMIFPKLFNVTVEVGEGGKTNVSDTFLIAYGASRTIKIIPDEGYEVADVVINGVSVGAVEEYIIRGANGKYSVEITFKEID